MKRLSLALALILFGLPLHAGVLFKGQLNGVPLTLEMGVDRTRVLATVEQSTHLVDLVNNHVYRTDAAGTRRFRAGGMDDGGSTLPYRLSDWSEGPPVAGHGSRYNVLQIDETICGEVLASRWMSDFMREIQQSIELIQRVDQRLQPIPRESCGAVPFLAFTRNGWPLMVGWKDVTVFQADVLKFDYRAEANRFDLPASWVE